MGTPEDDDTRATIDREAILARRSRFVAATLAGLTTSTLATACPCLKVAPPDMPTEPDMGSGEASESTQDDGDSMEETAPSEGGREGPNATEEPEPNATEEPEPNATEEPEPNATEELAPAADGGRT